MSISDILEHWASIYRPISHNPAKGSKDKAFYLVRTIDMASTFGNNSNTAKSPCMLYSMLCAGELKNGKMAQLAHQVWFMARVTDTAEKLGIFSEQRMNDTNEELLNIALDCISYLAELKRSAVCPITGRSFKDDKQLALELKALDLDTVGFGNPIDGLWQNKWLVMGLDFHTLRPVYNFSCEAGGKYIYPDESETPEPPEENG